MQEYYRDKVCVVTGGASGIGLAVTEGLLKCGAMVYIADIKQENLNKAEEQLCEFATKLFTVLTDVTKQPEVQRLIQNAAAEQGHLDFLFNNAGMGWTNPIETVTLEQWKFIIDLNLWSVIYGINAALPIMRKQGCGHIVNTSSVAGAFPIPFQAVYCGPKAAVLSIGEALRYELYDENIRFTTVCPSNVVTPIFAALGKVPEDAVTAEEAAKVILEDVAANVNIVYVPRDLKDKVLYLQNSPEKMEEYMINLSRERHENYRTKGTYC